MIQIKIYEDNDTTINPNLILSIEKRDKVEDGRKGVVFTYMIYICFDVSDNYYQLSFDNMTDRDKEYTRLVSELEQFIK